MNQFASATRRSRVTDGLTWDVVGNSRGPKDASLTPFPGQPHLVEVSRYTPHFALLAHHMGTSVIIL